MAIIEYDFEKYDVEKMSHLERHLEGSETHGSHFSKSSFPDARQLIDYAYNQIQDYSGKKIIREVEVWKPIGYDSLIELKNLPEEARVAKEPRGKENYLVNIVRGVLKKPTSKMIVVAGPIGEGRHGFYTIFPGENAPPFPAKIEKLIEMGYAGEELRIQEKINEQYREFWDNHGFISEN